METCLQPLWDLLRYPLNQLMEFWDSNSAFENQMAEESTKESLRDCKNILAMFWNALEDNEAIKKPEHMNKLAEIIDEVICSDKPAEILQKNIQDIIDEAGNCRLCVVCRECAVHFYKEIADGKFRERNLPYELSEYFSFKPQMYYYKEHMNSTHKHIQLQDCLLLLKGFSSSTPTVHSAIFDSNCLGGGIYINYKGKGIVIDPGIGFVRLMHEHGIYIEDIDTVIITHDHLDHNADAETISSLVYDYNSYNNRKDSVVCEVLELNRAKEHKINWIVDRDSHSKLQSKIVDSAFLGDYQEEQELSDGINGIFLSSIHTHHIRKNTETYGIKLRFQYELSEYIIGYTSDTAYFEEMDQFFENVNILIFNVSDIYKKDVKGIKDKRSHLGYNGSLKILNKTKPQIAIASEFCCTNGDFRMNCIRSLKDELGTKLSGNLLPGEIGMKIWLPENYFECSVCRRKVPVSEIHALEPVHEYGEIRYVCSRCML